VSVAGGCLYTMSVHYMQGVVNGCLRSISSVSTWYPLVGMPIGVHRPHSARLCHPSRLKIGTVHIYEGLFIMIHKLPRCALLQSWLIRF